MAKTIQITTKAKAKALLVESLFNTGGTLKSMRFDMGKYKASATLVGQEVPCSDGVVAVWAERRHDSHGPYKALFCLYR